MRALLLRVPPELRARLLAAWRRRWILVAAAWGLSVAGWLAVALVPSVYQAQARIYVDTDSLLTPLLSNITVDTNHANQLEVMQRTLLSRANLLRVVRAAGLDAEAGDPVALERRLVAVRQRITVAAEGRNLFSVGYPHKDPAVAQRVVALLLDIFVQANVGRDKENLAEAGSFIDAQIHGYEQQLEAAEHRLADYKARHVDVLAGTGTSFAVRLEAARGDEAAAQLDAQRAVVARDQVRAGLQGVPRYVDADAGGQPSAVSPALRVRQLEVQLAQLQSQYTDAYPEVVGTKRALEAARADLARAGDDATSHGRVPNTLYEQLRLRLVQADADVATAQSRLQLAEATVQRLSAVAEQAPKVEAELADLNREYGVLKGRYEDLLGRRESARLSAAAESSGDKVRFRVVDPPHVPPLPVWPNRLMLLTGVLLAALGGAAALAVLLDRLDDTVISVRAIRALGVEMPACLPRVDRPADHPRRRLDLRRLAAACAALLVLHGVALALSHLHPAAIAAAAKPPQAAPGEGQQ